jgi:hypothetical protein
MEDIKGEPAPESPECIFITQIEAINPEDLRLYDRIETDDKTILS